MQIFDRITAVDGAAVSELPASTCFGAKEVVKVVVQRPQLSDEQREVLLKELRERDGLGETSLLKAPSSERQSSSKQPCYYGALGSGLLSTLHRSQRKRAAWRAPLQGRYHGPEAVPKSPILRPPTPGETDGLGAGRGSEPSCSLHAFKEMSGGLGKCERSVETHAT